jgi:hypothetical protein
MARECAGPESKGSIDQIRMDPAGGGRRMIQILKSIGKRIHGFVVLWRLAMTEQELLGALATKERAEETTPAQFTKTVSDVNVPEALTATETFFRWAVVIGKKAARTANADRVYLGVTSTNNEQAYEIKPKETITINAPPGQKMDFQNWYLDVETVGDGVIVLYA